jgi:hypothetical protein
MSETPQLARAVLADQMAIIRAEFGEGVHQAALQQLSVTDRETLLGLGTLGWCDVEMAKRYKDSVADQVGQGSVEFQRWIVKTAASRTVKGIWRMLLSQVWDEALVKRIPVIYQRTFDKGAMSASFESIGTASIFVTGWPRIPDYDVIGLQVGIEGVLQALGREGTTAHATRTADGVHYRVRWKTK